MVRSGCASNAANGPVRPTATAHCRSASRCREQAMQTQPPDSRPRAARWARPSRSTALLVPALLLSIFTAGPARAEEPASYPRIKDTAYTRDAGEFSVGMFDL